MMAAELGLIFLCAVFNNASLAAELVPGTAELAALVGEAGRTKIFYGEPERRDSLIAALADMAQEDPTSLIDLLDTPWVLHFEVVRRALEKLGEPAAEALRGKLSAGGGGLPLNVLLAVFENLGKTGDEKILSSVLAAAEPGLEVPVARCLAVFGRGEPALAILLPWLDHPAARVRLAAVWAVGKVCKADRKQEAAEALINKVRALCNDSRPLVRFTAAETLGILGRRTENIRQPLAPGRK